MLIRMTNFLLALVMSLPIATVHASGSGGGGGGFGGGAGGGRRGDITRPPHEAVTDHQYELGKAILSGRIEQYREIRVCIDLGASLEKPGSGALSEFRGGSRDSLALALRDCPDGGQARRLSEVMEGVDIDAVVHYLDERYSLRLM